MSRVATLELQFVSQLAKARADYEAFKKEVESNPFRIPFGSSGGGGTTLGGLPTGPGQLPIAAAGGGVGGISQTLVIQQFNSAVTQTFTQISNALQAAGQAAAQSASQVTGGARKGLFGLESGSPFSGILNRFGRAGGAFFAYREVDSVLRTGSEMRQRDRLEEFEGTEKAARYDMEQTRSLGSQGIGHYVREHTTPFLRGLGGNLLTQKLFGKDLQTDTEREQQDRETATSLEVGQTQEHFRKSIRESERMRQTMNQDPVSRQQSDAQFQLQDAIEHAGSERSRANAIQPFNADAADALRRAANGYQKEAQRFYEEQQKRFQFLRTESINVLGNEDEALGLRATNRPLSAERYEIQAHGRATLDRMRFENDPRASAQEQVNADRLRVFDNEEKNRSDRIKLGLDTHGEQLAALLNRDPTSARTAGIVGQGIGQAKDLFNSEHPDLARQSLQNSITELSLTKQQYLDQFRAVQGNNFDYLAGPRDVEDPSTVLQNIQTGIDKINDTIKSLVSN